ncbi:MAG: hypothetical protein A2X18_07525 [Bacteroidetes bacterium GWF2_40_14]|nr:MAG: hypothetical protein A2X18_07525 [Bacteroidetes bacterium GWF2_40_14]
MKATETFKKTILDYLESRAKTDELFSVSFGKLNKNIDDCITYILNAVKASDCNGFADEEIFSMAVHYYDEDKIEVGKPINCNVVVNHAVELTEKDKQEAKQKAIDSLIDQERKKIVSRPVKTNLKPALEVQQASLF